MSPEHPLAGMRVLVTRPEAAGRALAEAFRAAGADPIVLPAFRLAPLDPSPLVEILRRARGLAYDTVVLTSPNAVRFFLDAVARAGLEPDALAAARLAVVGPATARALEGQELRADLVAEPHTGEGLVAALRAAGVPAGHRVLYPRAADARDVIERGLSALGARVDAVVTYAAVAERLDDPASVAARLDPAPDVVTFASPSAAILLEATLTPPVFARVRSGLQRAVTACIGPVTAEAVRALGYRVEIVAHEHSADGLTRAVVDYFSKEN